MEIEAGKVNQILKKYGYQLVMDMIHNEDELKKYQKSEKNFNRRKYLTIKKKDIVVGRVYQVQTEKELVVRSVLLNKQQLDIIIAFFKYFQIPHSLKVSRELAALASEDLESISVDLIRNNVFKQEAS